MNPHLAEIQRLLVPESSHLSSPSVEFIPHLYYAIHQVKKDPNSSTASLEAATSSIRHRLKQCKAHLAQNHECRELLSSTPAEWNVTLAQREKDLEAKQELCKQLALQVKQL
ncbi:LAFA_0F05996g1_1 [Lachancea sp. 'fantastica']|nr:LAFA_0F05996g1_1 [Lachancea sp. 'fantastica']